MNKLFELRRRLSKEEDKLMLLEFIDIGRKRRRGEKVSSLVWNFYLKYAPLSLILLISGYGLLILSLLESIFIDVTFLYFITSVSLVFILCIGGLISFVGFHASLNMKAIFILLEEKIDKFYDDYINKEVENAKK